MQDICRDLPAEYRELAALCESLTPSQWQARSAFHGWTAWDESAHLCYFDETGLQSAHDPAGFVRDAALLNALMARGDEISAVARERYAAFRSPAVRLRHIAHLGATTFRWAFNNRQLEAPAQLPSTALVAPDGSEWVWNEPSTDNFVRGSAEDLCLLVTQRRHLQDTALRHGGPGVAQWLAMARCVAGPPADGPAPGTRQVMD